MQQINKPNPDIRFRKDGLIEIRKRGVDKMRLFSCPNLSFFINEDNDLYAKPDENGIKPFDNKKSFWRYRSKDVCRKVLSLPDIPIGTQRASFRIGEEENGYYPIITRIILN
jgi:hypothetical protein